MQEENRRLIDEALDFEAVKNTFRLTREFIVLNKNFTFMAMGIFILLNVLGMIPLLSLIFSLLATVFGIVIQIHVGRTFYATENIETYVDEINNSRVDEVAKRYAQTAFGVYLGWTLLIILILFVLSLTAITTGLVNKNMNENDLIMAFAGLGLPLILAALIFSYVQPLVYSNIILSNSLGEGFKAVFSIFSKDVWSSALQKSYFSYIAKVGLLTMAIILLLGVMVALLSSIPIIGGFSMMFILGAIYLLMVFISISSMMARRIVEE